MKLTDIYVNKWYDTKSGFGKCCGVQGSGARARVEMHITGPIPRGRTYLSPRDIIARIDPPDPSPTK